jgi:hypothetical protein
LAPPERGAEQDDDHHRKKEQEEDARAPAQEPAQIGRGDRERLHRAISFPARRNASEPVMAANASIAATGPRDGGRARAAGQVLDPAQEPGLRGDEAECCEQAAGLRDGEERAVEHPEDEGDHRLPCLGWSGVRARGDERHHGGRGDRAGADQQRNAERNAPVGPRAGSAS